MVRHRNFNDIHDPPPTKRQKTTEYHSSHSPPRKQRRMSENRSSSPSSANRPKLSEHRPSISQSNSVRSSVSKVGDWSIAVQQAECVKPEYYEDEDDAKQRPGSRQKFTKGNYERYVILGTANIRMQFGTFISPIFRAICDTGAQAGLISLASAKAHALPMKPCRRYMNGIGGIDEFSKKVQAFILPWFNSAFRLSTELFVSDNFGGTQPWVNLNTLRPIDDNLIMADPHFDIPAPVDMLLAADVWSDIIGSLLYKHVSGTVMHETELGYVIIGTTWVPQEAFGTAVYPAMITQHEKEKDEEEALEVLLRKFFESEGIMEQNSALTAEEKAAEDAYMTSMYRKENGRFVVVIPLKPGMSIGESRKIVLRRFFTLERKLQKDDALREKYIEFMRELKQLGHMREAPAPQIGEVSYYIPHHAIDAEKFRTVFDASCRTSNGESLNSIQLIGPKLQADLQFHIMRFRRYRYAVVADVVKMFRQVCLHPSQWNLQRIFWRESPNDPLLEYQITVVMYGLASSLYNSVRSMMECARQYEKEYPQAVDVIRKCFYVDDGTFGDDTIAGLKMLCKEVEFVLRQGGFELSKWASNSISVEKYMQGDEGETVDLGESDKEAKVLGVRWLKANDQLTIVVKLTKEPKFTKRAILGEIARLYDPNGYVTPVLVVAKMLMQDIWKIDKLKWDEPVPDEIKARWSEFRQDLTKLGAFRIPRWLGTTKDCELQLHGFGDACKDAYGAAIYARVTNLQGEIRSILLAGRSKVVAKKDMPKIQNASVQADGVTPIHRLELLAAVMGSKLMKQIVEICGFDKAKQFMWSDSMVTLHWIRKSPLELKVYVSNRVKMIHEFTKNAQWAYIPTSENPADLVSRGMKADDLLASKLWKRGPSWLLESQAEWPKPRLVITPEDKLAINRETKERQTMISSVMLTYVGENLCELWHKFDNWKKVVRITAYVFRFIEYARMKDRTKWTRGEPEVQEIQKAVAFWINYGQMRAYKKEIELLKQGDSEFFMKSKIANLNPRLDARNILRVNGRIDKALVEYNMRHPIIIPPKSRLSYLLVHQAHKDTMHGSRKIMTAYLRRAYWIPQIRNDIKAVISECVTCTRHAQEMAKQIMAELPAVRVRPARPFDATGIDLAGPFYVKTTDKLNLSTRSRAAMPEIKGYVAVFVCMVTRAIHLEPVMDMSSEAFLQAFKRFAARRGHPEKVFSDNGPNLVGADRLLSEAVETWKSSDVQGYASWNGVRWTFITPGAPHEGGLWEAAVKSMKYHLKRVMGTQRYSYEGLATLLAGIEACLNSRPLCALSDDPQEIEALTPAHFLIGGPLKLPVAEAANKPPTKAKHLFEEIQAQTQSFWKEWQDNYLHALMNRPKWKEARKNIETGQLVLLKNENMPPTYWSMGRIIETRQAEDGKVRQVKVRVQNGVLERSIRKLCVLPTDQTLDYWVENERFNGGNVQTAAPTQ